MQNTNLYLMLLLLFITAQGVACNTTETKTAPAKPKVERVVSGIEFTWPAPPSKVDFPGKPEAEGLSVKTEDGDTYIWMSLVAEKTETLDANCASFVQAFSAPLQAEPITTKKDVDGNPICVFEVANENIALYGTMTKVGKTFNIAYGLIESSVKDASRVKRAKDFVNSLKFNYASGGTPQ